MPDRVDLDIDDGSFRSKILGDIALTEQLLQNLERVKTALKDINLSSSDRGILQGQASSTMARLAGSSASNAANSAVPGGSGPTSLSAAAGVGAVGATTGFGVPSLGAGGRAVFGGGGGTAALGVAAGAFSTAVAAGVIGGGGTAPIHVGTSQGAFGEGAQPNTPLTPRVYGKAISVVNGVPYAEYFNSDSSVSVAKNAGPSVGGSRSIPSHVSNRPFAGSEDTASSSGVFYPPSKRTFTASEWRSPGDEALRVQTASIVGGGSGQPFISPYGPDHDYRKWNNMMVDGAGQLRKDGMWAAGVQPGRMRPDAPGTDAQEQYYPSSAIGVGREMNLPYNSDAARRAYISRLQNTGVPEMRQTALTLGAGAIYAATSFTEQSLNAQTNTILNGGSVSSFQNNMGGMGRIAGAMVGVGIGALSGNPWIAGIAGGIGSGAGGAVTERLTAPLSDKLNAIQSQTALIGSMGYESPMSTKGFPAGASNIPEMLPHNAYLNPNYRAERFGTLAQFMNQQVRQGMSPGLKFAADKFGTPWDFNKDILAQGWGNISGGMMRGGINPFQAAPDTEKITFRPYEGMGGTTAAEDLARMRYAGDLSRGAHVGQPDMQAVISRALAEIKMTTKQLGGTEQIGEMYNRRLAMMYHEPEAYKAASARMGAVFAAAPSLGRDLSGKGANTLDTLMQFGPQTTSEFLRIQNDQLKASVSPEELMRVTGQLDQDQRALQFAGLQPMGQAKAAMGAFQKRMDIMSSIPGGKDSVAYAQAYQGFRASRMGAFETDTQTGFGMRSLALQGEAERMEVMPFSPGSVYRNRLGVLANNAGQIGRVEGMMTNKDLSENERYGLEAQRQGLMTSSAHAVATISEGFENRLPGMHAGTPPFFGRYSSLQGAALNLGRIGATFLRGFGAVGGAQRQGQLDWAHSWEGGRGAGFDRPYSRTNNINNPGSPVYAPHLLGAGRGPGGGGSDSGSVATGGDGGATVSTGGPRTVGGGTGMGGGFGGMGSDPAVLNVLERIAAGIDRLGSNNGRGPVGRVSSSRTQDVNGHLVASVNSKVGDLGQSNVRNNVG